MKTLRNFVCEITWLRIKELLLRTLTHHQTVTIEKLLNTDYLTVNKDNITTIDSSKKDSAEVDKSESFLEVWSLSSMIHHHKKSYRDHETVIHSIRESKKL